MMDKAVRFLILGAILGVSLTWLSSDVLSVRAETPVAGISEQRGVFTQTIEQELPCGAATQLLLHNDNGAVTVTSWEKDTVGVTAHKRARADQGLWGFLGFKTSDATVTAAIEAIDVRIEATPETIAVETVTPKGRIKCNRWVDYELRVPKSTQLELHTTNGRIDVTGIQGTIVAESSNGQIKTHATSGSLRAQTSNGAIVCRDAQGTLDLETSNGAITVAYAGALAADTPIDCTTSNGSIELSLPPDASFRLDAGTSNGHIQSEFPMPVTAGAKTQLAGVVGMGGPSVHLRTSNGGIHVARQ